MSLGQMAVDIFCRPKWSHALGTMTQNDDDGDPVHKEVNEYRQLLRDLPIQTASCYVTSRSKTCSSRWTVIDCRQPFPKLSANQEHQETGIGIGDDGV